MLTVMFAALSASAQTWDLVKALDYSKSQWQGWNFNSATHSFVDGTLQVKNEERKSDNYQLQYHGMDGVTVEEGETYKFCITMKGDAEGSIFAAVCDWGHNGQNGANLEFTTEMQTLEYEFTSGFSAGCFVMLQSGFYVGTYNIAKIEIYKKANANAVEIKTVAKDVTRDTHVAKVFKDQFSDVTAPITVVSPAKAEQDWDTQFWFVMKDALAKDATVTLTFDGKASAAQNLGFGAHGTPDGSAWKAGGVTDAVDLTTEWQTYTRKINAKAGWQSFALDLTKASEVTYEFDKISLVLNEAVDMGAASYNVKNGEEISRFGWNGLTISFPNNNVASVMAGIDAYEFGAVALNVTEAYLYEEGVDEPIASETFAMGEDEEEISLFVKAALKPATKYNVVIPAYGLKLKDQMNEEYYYANLKDITLSFSVKAVADEVAPEVTVPASVELTNGDFYLYNVEYNGFLCGANDWGTRASVSREKALKIAISAAGEGVYKLGAFSPDNADGVWIDGSRDGNNTFTFTASEDGATYAIGTTKFPGTVLTWTGDEGNTRVNFTESTANGTWVLMDQDTYDKFQNDPAKKAIAQIAKDKANLANIAARENLYAATNVVDPVAGPAYAAATADLRAQVEAGTYTGTVANPNAATGWHASTEYNFLLTPWKVGDVACNEFAAPMYINTWSVEGDTDGSEFKVPFHEYWTGDANSLGANDLNTTISGLTPGQEYEVSAWARVRIKNGATEAHGISLVAGDGEAVNVCAGKAYGVMRVMNVKAHGAADEEGNLKVSFLVDADNSISWLSFKNVYVDEYFAPVVTPSLALGDEEIALNSHSSVAVEMFDAIKVQVENLPNAVGASATIYGMTATEDEEGTAWNVNVSDEVFAGELSMNGGTAFVALDSTIVLEQGNKYEMAVTIYVNNGNDEYDEMVERFLIDGAYVAPMEIATSLMNGEEEVAINDHSSVSVEIANAIKVNVINAPEAIGVTYLINEMNQNEDEEGTFWTVGAEIASGEANLNGVAYAELDSTLYFEQGMKYQVTVTVMGGNPAEPAEMGTYTYEINGAYVAPIVITPALIYGEEEITLNDHSIVSVEQAEALKVNFENGAEVRSAMYIIQENEVDENGEPTYEGEEIAFGEMSINSIGYAEFEEAIKFEQGKQYMVRIMAFGAAEDVEGEELAQPVMPTPIATAEYLFNGAYVAELAVIPAFLNGEEEITLNDHSLVSVETAEALKVNFENGANVIGVTYAINEMVMGQDEEGTFWHVGAEVAVGEMSINSIAYAQFENAINFEAGKKYQLTVTAFENAEEPAEIGTYTFEFNGAYVLPNEVSEMAELFKQWDGTGADAEVVADVNDCVLNLGNATDCVYGWSNLDDLRYADLTEFEALVITYTDGFPRIMMNRVDGNFVTISEQANTEYYTVTENEDGSKTAIVDLKKFAEDHGGYAHLNSIKASAYNTQVTATELFVVRDAEEYVAIKNVEIAAAKNGKFMQNGKVVIVKNGKTYNMNGMLVK